MLGAVKSTATGATMVSPAPRFRPMRPGLDGGPRRGGLTTPEIDFPAGWDGGNLTVTGIDADGAAQSEVITASAGNAVAAANQYATVTSVTGAGTGADTDDATIRCSEGWHVQLTTTVAIRIGASGDIEFTTERGQGPIVEAYLANVDPYCFADVAIVGADNTTATGLVARGSYG